MAKLTSFTAFLLLLFFSSFLSHGLSRPISHESASDSSDPAIADEISSLKTPAIEEDWWFHNPWPFAQSPLPAGGFKWPHKKWPFVLPPMPAHGKTWPFVKPPFPCPWWPKKGVRNVDNGGKEIDGAAAPPLAASPLVA